MQGLLRQRASDVTFQDMEEACATRDGATALLDHFASIARPSEGITSLLVLVAYLATCPWMRGPLRVRVTADGDGMNVELSEHIDTATKIICWAGRLGAPIREIFDVLPHAASQLAPLKILAQRPDALVLGKRGVAASLPPPPEDALPDTRPAGATPISDLPSGNVEQVDELDEGW